MSKVNLSVCWGCSCMVTDLEEPYLWICSKGHVALGDKFECEDKE